MVSGQCLKGELSNDVPYSNLGLSFRETLPLRVLVTCLFLQYICGRITVKIPTNVAAFWESILMHKIKLEITRKQFN